MTIFYDYKTKFNEYFNTFNYKYIYLFEIHVKLKYGNFQKFFKVIFFAVLLVLFRTGGKITYIQKFVFSIHCKCSLLLTIVLIKIQSVHHYNKYMEWLLNVAIKIFSCYFTT